MSSNAAAALLLPEADDIDEMDDSELEQISNEAFNLLPGTPKKVFLAGCTLEQARDRSIVVDFLKHLYRNKYFGKTDNLEEEICRVLDPKNRGLVTQSGFAEGFPFILRLVQRIYQALQDKHERTNFLELKLDFLASLEGEDHVKHGLSRRATFTNAQDSPRLPRKLRRSCSGIPNRAKPVTNCTSIALNRRHGAPGSTSGVALRKIQEEGESFLKCRLQGLKCILKDADPHGTGNISWKQLRRQAPGLPEEPSIQFDPEKGVGIPLLIKILYPQEVASLLLKHYFDENTYGKKFVLPETKRQEIADLFCFMSGRTEVDTMQPISLYLGLRQLLELDTRDTAIAFYHLVVQPPRSANAGDGPQRGRVTLQNFTKWYSDHLLTDAFKSDHVHK